LYLEEDVLPPLKEEVRKAMTNLKKRKACGIDAIP
jgi:hypothetical protein